MEVTWVAIAALVMSIISLLYSLRTNYVNRRALQFRNLAELRTKNLKLRWKMHYRLSDLRDCVRSLSEINHPDADKWSDTISALENELRETDEHSRNLHDIYRLLEQFPILIPISKLESLHHHVDGITESVEVSRTELFARMKTYVEELMMLARESQQLCSNDKILDPPDGNKKISKNGQAARL